MTEVLTLLPRKNPRERLRIAVEVHNGKQRIDFRVSYKLTEATDIFTPTKAGVSFSPDQIPEVIAALCRARDGGAE